MINVKNQTLQTFLERLIDAFYNENVSRNRNNSIDVPYVISSLYQSMNRDKKYYYNFITDLLFYPDYIITVNDSISWDGIVDVDITLERNVEDADDQFYSNNPDHGYRIKFSIDERHFGYCQCTPDMPDYRADKQCCGHGCDADFCSFELSKVSRVVADSWHGDEHDYWDFEKEFYLSRLELGKKLEEEEHMKEIEELEARIAADQKRLAELKGNQSCIL